MQAFLAFLKQLFVNKACSSIWITCNSWGKSLQRALTNWPWTPKSLLEVNKMSNIFYCRIFHSHFSSIQIKSRYEKNCSFHLSCIINGSTYKILRLIINLDHLKCTSFHHLFAQEMSVWILAKQIIHVNYWGVPWSQKKLKILYIFIVLGKKQIIFYYYWLVESFQLPQLYPYELVNLKASMCSDSFFCKKG